MKHMTDLATWLLAQIARDAQGARALPHAIGNIQSLWSPDRLLAKADATRRIIELHRAEPGQHPDVCGHDLHELPCPTLRLECLPYADKRGYREEWRPDLS